MTDNEVAALAAFIGLVALTLYIIADLTVLGAT